MFNEPALNENIPIEWSPLNGIKNLNGSVLVLYELKFIQLYLLDTVQSIWKRIWLTTAYLTMYTACGPLMKTLVESFNNKI